LGNLRRRVPADLRHSAFRRFHDGGAGDHVGAAVIHFGEQAGEDQFCVPQTRSDVHVSIATLLGDRL